MYCQSCGAAAALGLSYCNQCGAKLRGADDVARPSEVKPELLVSAMVGAFVLGLGAIAVLVGVLKAVAGFDLPIILAITTLSFLLLLIIEGVLIGQLLRGRKRARAVRDADPAKEQSTKELAGVQAHGLPEPVPSVTEHTTRAFDPAYVERRSK